MKQFKTTEVIDEWTNAQTLFDKNYLVHNDIRKLTKFKKTREVKIEWTKQLVAQQKQKTERIKKETMLQNAKLDAQRVKDVRTTFSFAKESKHEIWKSRICGD